MHRPPSPPTAELVRDPPRTDLRGVVRRNVTHLGPPRPGQAGPPRPAGIDELVEEEPLELRVDGEVVGVTLRTPGDDEKLALGFLLAEGVIAGAADVGSVVRCARPGEDGYGNTLDVRPASGVRLDLSRFEEARRVLAIHSACGSCGRRTVDDLLARTPTLPPGPTLRLSLLTASMQRLAAHQPRFARTGGLHAAAAFAADGTLLAAHEDVGRHNAVDKVVGALLQQGRVGAGASGAPQAALLCVSGRAGFELVQKAAVARIPVLAAVGAASSLAVDLAVRAGVTVAAFVREGRASVYGNAERVAP